MAVRKRSHADILARHTHRKAFIDQGGIGHDFGHTPIYRLRARCHSVTVVENFRHLSMHHKTIGHFFELGSDSLEICLGDTGISRRIPVMANVGGPINKQLAVGFLHQA